MVNPFRIFTICATLLSCSHPARAADGSAPPADEFELQECRRNLHRLYEAIQAYRRVHHDIPSHLEELLPRFLSGAQLLTCPTARRLGLSSQDVAKWKGTSQTTYLYELGPEPVPGIISGGSSRSMREWKRLQMGLVGSEVPMVRCHTHERAVLNLSFGGRIYETSNIDWETRFDDVVDLPELSFSRRLTAYTVSKKLVVPERDPHTPAGSVDLSAYYTHRLDEAWPGPGSLRPLATMSAGLAQLGGSSFDVRGFIQLGAARAGLAAYPAAVSNIVVGLPGRRVTLLLGTRHRVAPNTRIADCVFHLANGQVRRLRIEYGHHVLACLSEPAEPATALPEARLGWQGEIGDGQIARLYQCAWTNPSWEEVISSMDFIAQPGDSGAFLVAVNVEPVR